MMEQFIELVISLNHKEILIFIAFIWIMTKRPSEKISDFIGEFRFRDVDSGLIKLFIEKDNFSRDLSDSLIEHFESLAFYRAYGMRANKKQRTILLEFYSKHKEEITLQDLKKAYKNIEFVDSSIQVNFYVISTLYHLINTLVMVVISCLLLFFLCNYIFFDHSDKSLKALVITFIYFGALSFFNFDKSKSSSIIRIQDCIDKT